MKEVFDFCRFNRSRFTICILVFILFLLLLCRPVTTGLDWFTRLIATWIKQNAYKLTFFLSFVLILVVRFKPYISWTGAQPWYSMEPIHIVNVNKKLTVVVPCQVSMPWWPSSPQPWPPGARAQLYLSMLFSFFSSLCAVPVGPFPDGGPKRDRRRKGVIEVLYWL